MVSQSNNAKRRASAARELLQSWAADDSGYDKETYPQLARGLAENRKRTGERSPFHDEQAQPGDLVNPRR